MNNALAKSANREMLVFFLIQSTISRSDCCNCHKNSIWKKIQMHYLEADRAPVFSLWITRPEPSRQRTRRSGRHIEAHSKRLMLQIVLVGHHANQPTSVRISHHVAVILSCVWGPGSARILGRSRLAVGKSAAKKIVYLVSVKVISNVFFVDVGKYISFDKALRQIIWNACSLN